MLEEDEKYFNGKRFHRLLQRYEEAMQQRGSLYMEAEELTDIAEYYAMKGRMDEAGEAIQLALSLHPDSVDPQVFLARQQMFLGNMAKAYELADSIPDQEDREVFFLRAELYLNEEHYIEAKNYLLDLYYTLSQDDEPDFFLYDSAALLYDYSAWEQTMELLDILQEKHAPMEKAKRLRINTLLEMMRYEEAIDEADAFLEAHPYDVTIWVVKGEAASAMERQEEAREAADFALAIEPRNPRALVLAGNTCFHVGLHAEAHEFFETYLKDYPDEGSARFLNSLCLSALGQYAEALEELKRIDMTSPSVAEMQEGILLHRAMTESQLGNLEDALAWEVNYEARRNQYDKNVSMLRGFIFLNCGKKERAMKLLREGLNEVPPLDVAFDAPIQLLEHDMVEEAIEMLLLMDKLYAKDKERERIAPMLAHCYYQKGDKPAFLRTFLRALQHEPELTANVFRINLPHTNDPQELLRSACMQLMDLDNNKPEQTTES